MSAAVGCPCWAATPQPAEPQRLAGPSVLTAALPLLFHPGVSALPAPCRATHPPSLCLLQFAARPSFASTRMFHAGAPPPPSSSPPPTPLSQHLHQHRHYRLPCRGRRACLHGSCGQASEVQLGSCRSQLVATRVLVWLTGGWSVASVPSLVPSRCSHRRWIAPRLSSDVEDEMKGMNPSRNIVQGCYCEVCDSHE